MYHFQFRELFFMLLYIMINIFLVSCVVTVMAVLNAAFLDFEKNFSK